MHGPPVHHTRLREPTDRRRPHYCHKNIETRPQCAHDVQQTRACGSHAHRQRSRHNGSTASGHARRCGHSRGSGLLVWRKRQQRRQWRRRWWRRRKRARRRHQQRWLLRRGQRLGRTRRRLAVAVSGGRLQGPHPCASDCVSEGGSRGRERPEVPHPEGIIGRMSAGGRGDLPQLQRGDRAGLWPTEPAQRAEDTGRQCSWPVDDLRVHIVKCRS